MTPSYTAVGLFLAVTALYLGALCLEGALTPWTNDDEEPPEDPSKDEPSDNPDP